MTRYVDTERGRLSHKLRDGKYRARKMGCEYIPFTLDQACELLLADTKCYYCGCEVSLTRPLAFAYVEGPNGYTLEHKHPLKKRGPHSLDNLAKACSNCNQDKRISMELDYLAEIDKAWNG